MRRLILLGFLLLSVAAAAVGPANAQAIPKSLQESGPEATIRQRKNAWTIGIVAGLVDGSNMRFADQLAKALDDGDDLRILPIVSHGSASNLEDLLYLQGVDAAITQGDVFEFFKTERRTPNLQGRVRYVLRLPNTELHILAREDIRTIQDLKGKKVNFGPPGSGSSLTGTIVFQRLGIPVEQVLINQSSALHKLQSGEVSALVRMVNKPVDFFAKLPPGSGLHFLSVPFSQRMADYYNRGELTSTDYPSLVPSGTVVDTISVAAVLAVFNWTPGTERYKKVERFVQRLFANWRKLQSPPFHPQWREIDLTAKVPGWTRLPLAEELLQQTLADKDKRDRQSLRREFDEFLEVSDDVPTGAVDKEELFRKFLRWRQTHGVKP